MIDFRSNQNPPYLKDLEKISKVAKGSRWSRLLFNPLGYMQGMFYSKFLYPMQKKGTEVQKMTFFNDAMTFVLPSGLDIYLLGAKSHDSEIRLAKFLCRYLSPKETFFDIGGHIGYFSLLAARLVGSEGVIHGFEAASSTFHYYEKNVASSNNIHVWYSAVGDTNGTQTFHEYPVLYSEYNSLESEQYKDESWATNIKPNEVLVPCITLQSFVENHQCYPDMIKIDVEGAELKVILGANQVLINHKPVVIMEFLQPKKKDWNNDPHYLAVKELLSLGYDGYLIDNEGHVHKTEMYIHLLEKMESDNLVFIHPSR